MPRPPVIDRDHFNRNVPFPRNRRALLDWREAHSFTQPEAADLLKISLRAFQNYEQGRRPIPGAVLMLTRLPLTMLKKIQQPGRKP